MALVGHGFVARERAAGTLVAPLDVAPLELGHWLAVYGRGVLDDACVAAFRDWRVRETAADAAPVAPAAVLA